MEPLYLIRQERFNIFGPMNLKDAQKFIASQRDVLDSVEIAGNLGPWLFLHKDEELKAAYPDLSKIIGRT